MIWTDPAADRAQALTQLPPECLAPPRSVEARRIVEAGRALFRSRTLLGGPAARVGLSCDSCHTNGRANTHFLLPELTDRPGAADVTSEWSSKVRGDGVMNPRAIPDLAGVAGRASFGVRAEPSLDGFVHGVIVEEFQGPEPPPGARAAVLSYLEALDLAACPAQHETVTIRALADDVRRALEAALQTARAGDAATADLTVLAAQDAIARLAERLPRHRFAAEHNTLAALSRELGETRGVQPPALPASWHARFDAVTARIERREQRTFTNPAVLNAALEKSRLAR